MCGIAGSVNVSQSSFIEDSLNSIHHRGPDSSGFIKDGRFSLGMKRLSIVDVDNGDQPISNNKGDIHLVCNGEIYNSPEMRGFKR